MQHKRVRKISQYDIRSSDSTTVSSAIVSLYGLALVMCDDLGNMLSELGDVSIEEF